MKTKSGVTLSRTIHANRVPLGALTTLLALVVVAACAVGGARIVGPSSPPGSSTPPGGPSTTAPPANPGNPANPANPGNPTVATITVGAPSSSMTLLQTLQARATAYDASGNVLPGAAFTWSSSNTVVATVSNTGLITARLVGTSNITATSGSVTSAAFAVRVAP